MKGGEIESREMHMSATDFMPEPYGTSRLSVPPALAETERAFNNEE
jgi:hypothetical protein